MIPFWKLVLCLAGGVVLATSLVFGGTALSDEELDMVGAGGTHVAVANEKQVALPLTDEELEETSATGSLPRFIWPFQHVPEQISDGSSITGSYMLDEKGISSFARGLNFKGSAPNNYSKGELYSSHPYR